MSAFSRAREADTLVMLDASDTPTLSTSPASDSVSDSVLVSRELIERLQAQVKFEQTRNEALNFEIARLKRWRFGSSAESLDTSTQAVLFDAILADTALEDSAAKQANKPPPAAPGVKGKAVRQALPANLPRVDRHYDIGATHCACGQAFKRIGEEVSEQLDCVPAQFFVLRHIRGKYAWRVLPDHPGRAHARADDRQGAPGGHEGALTGPRACWPRWLFAEDRRFPCRCTARPRSTPAQELSPDANSPEDCLRLAKGRASGPARPARPPSRARAWRSGWASAACAWSRWPQR